MELSQINAIEQILDFAHQAEENTYTDAHFQLFDAFTQVSEWATSEEAISFTTLFSRLSYIGTKYDLPRDIRYRLQSYRRLCEKQIHKTEDITSEVIEFGQYAVMVLLEIVTESSYKNHAFLPAVLSLTRDDKTVRKAFIPLLDVLIIKVDHASMQIEFVREDQGDTTHIALFDIADKNENFSNSIASLDRSIPLPVHATLLEVDVTDTDTYVPSAIVIQPDYLVDVTSIAECYDTFGPEPIHYLVNKFLPRTPSISIMVGNAVNYLLDEVVHDPEIDFRSLFGQIFATAPLQFALLSDKEVKEVLNKCYTHFNNIKHSVLHEFPTQGIKTKEVYLEPSFMARDFGLQGRLDLLHLSFQKGMLNIVELKSGKIYRPNAYGQNNNHYIQTMLYHLMMRSVYKDRFKKLNSYILYSQESKEQLRFAPEVRQIQYSALAVRNELLSLEYELAKSDPNSKSLLDNIRLAHYPDFKGFKKENLQTFENLLQTADPLTKAYFKQFAAFVAREHHMAKIGEHGLNNANGQAALWLETMNEKINRFSIITYLDIETNQSEAAIPIIRFKKTAQTNPLANFRIGDIVVLYPASDDQESTLTNQIFKCTIIGMNDSYIEVRLRSRQSNQEIFNRYHSWNIEQDLLDSTFNGMYRSLYQWLSAARPMRDLLLGRRAPQQSKEPISGTAVQGMTTNQQRLLQEMIYAKDYYLLWGPPGTGKTSQMLRQYVEHVYTQHPDQNILLLAYTNRAVDEICDAVLSFLNQEDSPFIRLGSNYGCGEAYRPWLLTNRLQHISSRQEIIHLLDTHRVVISTVSSIMGQQEIFELKQFDTVVIDEASQLLEPMLVGLLCQFNKFILIGDHKQLPAVVTQKYSDREVKDPSLKALGISDFGMSFFERLILNAQAKEWHHAYGLLEEQGRMHRELMDFPNTHFYNQKLSAISMIDRLQAAPKLLPHNEVQKLLFENRRLYIPTRVHPSSNWKINQYEAKCVVRVIKYLIRWYEDNGLEILADDIGIITPYRAQIAQINFSLQQEGIHIPITVDTVERYQGGARNIIILSMCVNRLSQLENLVSSGIDGIDRKLNVALTRAKEQIILIGNQELLQTNPTYAALIDQYKSWKLDG